MSTNEELAQKAFDLVRPRFAWVSDKVNFGVGEYWKNFSNEVLAGYDFNGECDDFTLTCINILAGYGAQPKDVTAIFLRIKSTNERHLVAGLDDDEANTTWILDNRNRAWVYKWTDLKDYEMIASKRMSENVWRKVGQ